MTLMIVGEAWGEEEARQRRPFVGASGKLLNELISDSGLPPRSECYVTNVFNLQPRPTNAIENLCGKKLEGKPGVKPLNRKYLLEKYWPEVERLWEEIKSVSPTMILALGGTALWATVSGVHSIRNVRGTTFLGHFGVKVLPTYHPAAVLRDPALRPIVMMDFAKAKREFDKGPKVSFKPRRLLIGPSIEDIENFYGEFLLPNKDKPWGVDIETKAGTITEVGFSTSSLGIVIPFHSRETADGNYWPTIESELRAWRYVEWYLETITCPVFQNGLYDLSYLWRTMRIRVPHAHHDTMLAHHALYPGMQKSLGFLASLYADAPYWKSMRDKSADTWKQEDE